MFGDWGHGICLLLGALILIARESKLSAQVRPLCELLAFKFKRMYNQETLFLITNELYCFS